MSDGFMELYEKYVEKMKGKPFGVLTTGDGESYTIYRTASNASCDSFAVDGPDGWQSFNTALYWEYVYEVVDFVAKRIGAVAEDCMFTKDYGTRDFYELLWEEEYE